MNCFNSINKQLKPARVKAWIENFTNRLIKCPNSTEVKNPYKTWYMEKYVFILELLVTKNIDKIEKDITLKLTEITKLDKTHFNRTTWYKVVKILAHLRYLSFLFKDQEIFKNVFIFILDACKHAKENLCFYFIMKIVSLMKKADMHLCVKSSGLLKEYSDFFDICTDFLKANYQEKSDPLILEILLYVIEFYDYLLKFTELHDMLNENEIIYTIASMLSIHENKHILKAISVILSNASKCIIFNADFLTNNRMESILTNILVAGEDQERCGNLFECCLSIISNTKVPVKFMIASSILKLTDPRLKMITRDLNRDCVIQIIQVLTYILSNLESTKFGNVKQEELSRKTHKYCLIAMTNIMIRYDPHLIFEPKISAANGDLRLIMAGASFESDPQVHLRILYILYNVADIKPLTSETSEIIIELLMNIYNFRYVLTMDDDYHFPIKPCTYAKSLQQNTNEKDSLISIKNLQKENEEASSNSKAVPLSENNMERNSNNKSNSSVMRETIEEEESKLCSDETADTNLFYFESEEFELRKIDGLRMSLCMAIKILSRLSSVNKRANCTQIFNSKFDRFDALFDYFWPIINRRSNKCNEYIICVLEIIRFGAEIGKLEDIILRKDTVKHLIGLLRVVLSQGQNEMILIILEIFNHLSTEPKFYNYLQIESPTSLLDDKSLRENKNEAIKAKANTLFEHVINNDSQKYSYIMPYDSEELKNIKTAPLKKQLSFLKNFEDAIQQNKAKFDQQNDADIENLIEVCTFDKYNSSIESEESFSNFGDISYFPEAKDPSDDEQEESQQGNKLHRKILLAISIMKCLAKSKLDRIKSRIHKFVSHQRETHLQLLKISSEHLYSIFEFYLEYFKNNYYLIKSNKLIEQMMFQMSELILNEKDLPSKDLKNVIEFCTFIMKNSETEECLQKITDCSRLMIFTISNKEESIRNSISSFIKLIYFNPISINDLW